MCKKVLRVLMKKQEKGYESSETEISSSKEEVAGLDLKGWVKLGPSEIGSGENQDWAMEGELQPLGHGQACTNTRKQGLLSVPAGLGLITEKWITAQQPAPGVAETRSRHWSPWAWWKPHSEWPAGFSTQRPFGGSLFCIPCWCWRRGENYKASWETFLLCL